MDPGKVMNDGTVDEVTGEMFDPDGNLETEDERDQRRTMLLVHYLTRSEAVKAERDAKRDATAEEVSAKRHSPYYQSWLWQWFPKHQQQSFRQQRKHYLLSKKIPLWMGQQSGATIAEISYKRYPRTTTNTWVFSVAETLSLNILQRSIAPKSIRKPGQMEILRLSLFFAAPSSLGLTHL